MGKDKSVWKGAVAGLAGGIAGTLAMTAFQSFWSRAQSESPNGHGPTEEPATVKAACDIAQRVFHRPLTEGEKGHAGLMVHYGFGAMSGAFYGALSELSPVTRMGAGLVFGSGLFVTADEVLVPLLGWSGAPQKYPVTSHLYGWASHAVYGVSSELARRMVRSRL